MRAKWVPKPAHLLGLAAVGLCLVGLLAIPAQPAVADDPPIQISTEISPSEPAIGESVSINVKISNLESRSNRNVKIHTVYLRQPDTANTYDRFSNPGTIASGGSMTLPLKTTFDSVGQKQIELRVTAQFTDTDESPSRYTYPVFIDVNESNTDEDNESDVRGEVRLTTTEVSGSSDVTVQGDVSNIGGTDVESVLLSVNDTETVSPASPNREYFVGSVEASKFGTFELTAAAEPEAESIPIDITYIVDGERVTKTQQIPLDASTTGDSTTSTQTDTTRADTTGTDPATGVPVVPIGVALAVLAISAGGVILWRR